MFYHEKWRSKSWSTTFTMVPFDGKYHHLKSHMTHFCDSFRLFRDTNISNFLPSKFMSRSWSTTFSVVSFDRRFWDIEWYNCKCFSTWPLLTFSRLQNLKWEYLQKYEFYRGWYSLSNVTMVYNICNDLHFQCQIFLIQVTVAFIVISRSCLEGCGFDSHCRLGSILRFKFNSRP